MKWDRYRGYEAANELEGWKNWGRGWGGGDDESSVAKSSQPLFLKQRPLWNFSAEIFRKTACFHERSNLLNLVEGRGGF